jgi:hypothetical protein
LSQSFEATLKPGDAIASITLDGALTKKVRIPSLMPSFLGKGSAIRPASSLALSPSSTDFTILSAKPQS